MLNQTTIIGRVVEVLPDRDAINVVIRTGSGEKNGRAWDELAVVRFWGDVKKYTDNLGVNDLVRVDASVKSRPATKGGYFTACEARYLKRIEGGAQPAAARGEPPKLWNEPKPADDDIDDTPF